MPDNRRAVKWAKIDRIDTPTVALDLFEYRADRGWRWVQRALFKALAWIGAHSQPVVTTFTRTPQENDALLQSLIGQREQYVELIHRRGPARFYVGPDEYPELVRLCEHVGMVPTTHMGRIKTADRDSMRWNDIPITVIPWMVGAILVPESFDSLRGY